MLNSMSGNNPESHFLVLNNNFNEAAVRCNINAYLEVEKSD